MATGTDTQLSIAPYSEGFRLTAHRGMGPRLTAYLARCRKAGLKYDRGLDAQVGDTAAMARAVQALLDLGGFRFDVTTEDAETLAMAAKAPEPAADDLGGAQ